MSLPLGHISVIDLTRARSGPTCVRQLADMGARVIKVEQPDDEEGTRRHHFDFQNLHRNKQSLILNLKDERGKDILKKLVRSADVLVENYRPEVKNRLGIDYASLKPLNPRLVYASISGFGQTGPYSNRPGYDQLAQGMGGLMSITGQPGSGPWRVGIPVADLSAGLLAAQGVLLALLERERSGEGQWVQTSLLEAMISMLDFQATRWLIGHEVPPQAGNNHPTSIPTGSFRVKDGHINIASGGQHMWKRLCQVLEAEHLYEDPRFASPGRRSRNRDELSHQLEKRLARKTAAEWIAALNDAGVPSGPILSIDQVFANEQVEHLGLATPVAHPQLGEIRVLGLPVTLSRTPGAVRTPTPEKGQQTDEILHELGLSAEDIQGLREDKVV